MKNGRNTQQSAFGLLRMLILRYLPAELVGTASALLAAWWAQQGGTAAVVVAAVTAEAVGFYAVIAATVSREQWQHTAGRPRRRIQTARRTVALLVAEFGPAELLDTFVVRPAFLVLALQLVDSVIGATLVGKIAADLVFYVFAALAFGLTVHTGVRQSGAADRQAAADRHLFEARRVLALPAVQQAVAAGDLPLLVLEPDRVSAGYRRLQRAMPQVDFHYAVKALAHEAVVAAVANAGGWFDVASVGELDLVRRCGVPGRRIIFTHPVKTRRTIDKALAAGVTTFVIDTAAELAKFRTDDRARLLVRLSFPNAVAVSDLSTKFGIAPDAAVGLVRQGIARGLDVDGFSFHVGSQLDDVQPWVRAVTTSLALIDELQAQGITLRVLDLGGGLPAPYTGDVIGIEDVARALEPLLADRRLQILAEPGRVVVAEAMTLIASVVGVDHRHGVRWCHLDDGVYGSWSNVMYEKITPPIVPVPAVDRGPAVRTTLAGPTCDSVDVIVRDELLVPLEPGDLVVSPVMGAYTAVSATSFNGLPPTPILVVDQRVPTQRPPADRGLRAAPITPAHPVRIAALTRSHAPGRG